MDYLRSLTGLDLDNVVGGRLKRMMERCWCGCLRGVESGRWWMSLFRRSGSMLWGVAEGRLRGGAGRFLHRGDCEYGSHAAVRGMSKETDCRAGAQRRQGCDAVRPEEHHLP